MPVIKLPKKLLSQPNFEVPQPGPSTSVQQNRRALVPVQHEVKAVRVSPRRVLNTVSSPEKKSVPVRQRPKLLPSPPAPGRNFLPELVPPNVVIPRNRQETVLPTNRHETVLPTNQQPRRLISFQQFRNRYRPPPVAPVKVKVPAVPVVQRKKKKTSANLKVSHGSYVKAYRTMKQRYPGRQLSKEFVELMDNFMIDIFERLATESSTLLKHSGRKTLTQVQLKSAVALVINGQLGILADSNGKKALEAFRISAL